MKKGYRVHPVSLGIILMFMVLSCSKPENSSPNQPDPVDTTDTTHVDTTSRDSFTTYTILKGNNYCEKNEYPIFRQSSLKFKAIFDSSCIYTTVDPVNQEDINKLYGFSDCNTLHHANSARFGWNWMNGKMHIHAYYYADSVREFKELGTVALNKEIICSIELLPEKYVFTLNGKKDTVQRHCSDTVASGIKLLPYFGGDEPAPKDVRIKIKELK
ncbi:MAG TPA: hypothetical protein VL098_12180 [Flavipsychrobacter sp.]|nr:hypothetical protein [Flavipsychrobacter sp.]